MDFRFTIQATILSIIMAIGMMLLVITTAAIGP